MKAFSYGYCGCSVAELFNDGLELFITFFVGSVGLSYVEVLVNQHYVAAFHGAGGFDVEDLIVCIIFFDGIDDLKLFTVS